MVAPPGTGSLTTTQVMSLCASISSRTLTTSPRGRHVVEYTVRLNNPGRFVLPPSRVEAMYAPESFAESPNPGIEVAP